MPTPETEYEHAKKELQNALLDLWHMHLPKLVADPSQPFGVRCSWNVSCPPIKPPEPGLIMAINATRDIVQSYLSGGWLGHFGAVCLYAAYRIYWNVRQDYRISEKKRRHEGEDKFIVIRQLALETKHIPVELAAFEELVRTLWPLVPTLVRLQRASSSLERIELWWNQFANAAFVLMLTTPGSCLQPLLLKVADGMVPRRLHNPNDEDYASSFVATLVERAYVAKFVRRYEPPPVDSLQAAATKAVRYSLKAMKNTLRDLSRNKQSTKIWTEYLESQKTDLLELWTAADHLETSPEALLVDEQLSLNRDAGKPWSASKAKRLAKAGIKTTDGAERAQIDRDMSDRKKHRIEGYVSQVQIATVVGRPRSSVQNAIRRALSAGAFSLGPQGRLSLEDVPKVLRYLNS